jgi:hydrogenase/urease accessory protein HupE
MRPQCTVHNTRFRTKPGIVGIAIAALLAVAPVLAHPTPYSYIDLNVGAARLDASVVAYAFDIAHDLGIPGEPQRFDDGFLRDQGEAWADLATSRLRVRTDGRAAVFIPVDVELGPGGATVVVRLRAHTERPREIDVDAWLFPYDSLHQTFLKTYEDGQLVSEDILTASRPSATRVVGRPQTRLDVVRRFLVSGIAHIAIGPDHILFLVGLLLAGGTAWRIVRIVTAFTIAHSVTLSLAVLGVVVPPSRIVEPAIAASVCLVGIDNLVRRPGARDRRSWIAFAFGLIHGFGFAGVLRDMDLPTAALGWSLLSFNAGVEIGQLAIVVVVSSALAWLARAHAVVHRRVVVAGSVVVIWAGFYWLVERI